MPKRFLVLDLATGTIDAAITAAMQAAIAASVASNIVKITVDDEAARYALTPAQAQNGDYVYQADTATLYEVIDQTLLNGATGYVALATVTAAQISDASASGRALLTGNVRIGTGSDSVALQTLGDTQLQLPTSGRLGTSSVLLTNHQALNGSTLVKGVKYGVRQDGYNGAYVYLPTDATAGDVIELEDIEGQWGQYSFTLYASSQYLNGSWYGSLDCASAFSRVRAVYIGNGYWTVSVDDPGKFTEIGWDGNSSLYPVAGDRWGLTNQTYYSIYLPSNGNQGDEILIRDDGSNWSNYGLWIYGQNTYLNGQWYGNFYCSTSGATIRCVYGYDSSTGQTGWMVTLETSPGASAWTVDSSSTTYFNPQAGQRFAFTYTSPGQTLYAYLPSSPGVGDEIWIADGGRNWSAYPLDISANDQINGEWNDFTTSARWAVVRCVYLGGSIGWNITESAPPSGAWITENSSTVYPSAGAWLSLTYSSTAYVYLPSSANDGDEILVRDGGNHWGSYGVYIYGQSTYLNGQWYGNFYCNASGATIRCVYGYDSSSGTTGWQVQTLPTPLDTAWTVNSSSTTSFNPVQGKRYVFTYAYPSGSLSAYLPYNPTIGDEIWIADGGRNWSAYPLTLSASDYINGNSGGFTASTRWALVRCVYLGGSIGWSVAQSGGSTGGWQTAAGSSLYPAAGDQLDLTYSSTPSVYLPSNANEGDQILIRDGGNHWGSYGVNIYGNSTYLNGQWYGSFYSNASGATIRCLYGYDSSIGTWGWIVGVGSTESWLKVSDSAQRVFAGCKYLYAPSSNGFYVNLPHSYSWQRQPGDEIWLADPGQTWGTYQFYIQMPNGSYSSSIGDMINGASVPFYADRPGGKIRCVYVDDYTGWTVAYADEGRWRTGIDDSLMLYPNGRYSCTFTSARTLTLPRPDAQNLQPGDEILIEDAGIAGTSGWASHNLTIDNNGQNINGVSTSKTVATNGATVRCVWAGGSTGWSVKTLPGTVL